MAVCGSVLQCVAACCGVLRCVAVLCGALQCERMEFVISLYGHIFGASGLMQCVAVCCVHAGKV